MTKSNFLLSILRCLDKMSQKWKRNVFCHSSICIAETKYSYILSEEGASNNRNILKMCISVRVFWYVENSFTLNINGRAPILPCLTKMSHRESLTFLTFSSEYALKTGVYLFYCAYSFLHIVWKKIFKSLNK